MTLTQKLHDATIGVTTKEATTYQKASEGFQVAQTPRQLYERGIKDLEASERYDRDNGITFKM